MKIIVLSTISLILLFNNIKANEKEYASLNFANQIVRAFDSSLVASKNADEKNQKFKTFFDSSGFENIPLKARINYIYQFIENSSIPFTDSLSLFLHMKVAAFNMELGKFDIAFTLLDSVTHHTSKVLLPNIYFESLALIGYSHRRLNNNNESFSYLVKLLSEAKEINNLNGEFIGNLYLGDYYRKIGKPEQSVSHYYRADEIAEIENDFKKLDRSKAKIGRMLQTAGEDSLAKIYFKKSLEYSKKLNNVEKIISMEYTLLQSSKKHSNEEKIKILNEHIKKLNQIGLTKSLAKAYDWAAKLYYRNGKFEKSKEYSFKAIEFGKIGKLNYAIVYSYTRLAIMELEERKFSKAFSYLKKAEKHFFSDERPGYGTYIYETMSDCYIGLGKYQLAIEAMRKAKKYQTQANKINTKKKIAVRFAKYALEKEKKNEFEIQKKKNDLQKRQNDVRRIENEQILDERMYVILSLFGILFTILMVLFYTIKISKERKKRKKSLSIQNEKNKLIEEQRNELDHLNKMKDQFFSVIAHDLRGPVGNMTRLSKLILMTSQQKKDEENIKIASLLSSSSKNIQLLLQSLLLWGKVQMKVTEPNKSEYYIKSRIAEITKFYKESIVSKHITLKISIDESHILFVDEGMIDAVFRNLIHNAVKFSNDGGNVEIKSYFVDNAICINVIDDGIGLDKKKIMGVLSESTTQQNSKSKSGLGLILAKEFIALNGGKMSIESELGKGTNVKFSLPKLQNHV